MRCIDSNGSAGCPIACGARKRIFDLRNEPMGFWTGNVAIGNR